MNDYIDLGDIYDDVSLPVTVSVWLYLETTAQGSLPIIDSQDNSDLYNGFTMIVSNYPHIGLTYGDGLGGNAPAFRSSRAASFNIIQGRWIHATGVYRGAHNFSVYLNGEDIGGWGEGNSTAPMNSFSPDEVAKIGTWFSNGNTFWFKGMMDELRVYNRALSESEVRDDMCRRLQGNENGLIGYWRFDETSGQTAFDSSQKGYHGVLKGNPQRILSGAPIGDISTYVYDNSSNLSLDNIDVSNISASSFGAHIYKVLDAPTETSGLPIDLNIKPYYGVFLAHDNPTNSFTIETGNTSCLRFVRKDNSITSWTSGTSLIFPAERTEIIFSDGIPVPDFALGGTRIICPGSQLRLSPVTNNTSSFEFHWQDGSAEPFFDVNAPGVYSVEIKGECGEKSASVTVVSGSFVPPFSLGADKILCAGDKVRLAPFSEDVPYDFAWQDGSNLPYIDVTGDGVYSVRVKGDCDEKQDEIVFSRVHLEADELPNVITPNGDIWNEMFTMPVFHRPSELNIFNRWGRKVYESNDYQNDWNGGDLPTGTYYWRLNGACVGELKGTVSIVR